VIETTPKEQQSLAGHTTLPNDPIVMRPHPGAGTIMSWEPNCAPQVMTVIISLEPYRRRTEIISNQATPVAGMV
jgi:hypothetical protein